ncbi:fimbrial protein [Serratia fonticola]|uniref:fimbrial protein n=1 Tax=Serratia fonticola TaxID=47917 RepID=UPI0015C5B8F7|nr:fimbrial protein [Serratia fonticola]NXZ90380.1 fimbrial protein [Serratia fonticola]NYA46762.1 fimbrial protein [Serratia fonticola]
MFKNLKIFVIAVVVFYSDISYSYIECSGCTNSTVNTNITKALSSGDNEIGKVVAGDNITTGEFDFTAYFSPSPTYLNEWFAYAGESVSPAGTSNTTWSFRKVDDYISIALRYVNNCGGEHFAPFNTKVLTQFACVPQRYASSPRGDHWYPRTFQTAMRIDKKIVSGTYSKNILVGEYGICMNASGNCQNKEVVFSRIYVSINVTVPQTCELNAGQVLNIDFGNISSGAFKTAGAIAQGVQPKAKVVSIKCDNIDGNAQLTLRVQADKVSGNMVVSDENKDVGFRVTNNSGTPLIPNDLSSVITFALDSNARQNVTIQAYPVSVTGNKPTEGPVTSRAYLRVDFP